MKTPLLALLVVTLIPAAFSSADDKAAAPKEEAKPGDAAAAPPASDPLDSADIAVLRANSGQEKTVRGKIIRVKDWDGGLQKKKPMNFIDFQGGHFSVVTFADDYPKFKDGLPAKLYANKTIEVTGKIEERNGNYQIVLRDPAQVKIVDAAPADPKKDKDAKPDAKKDDRKKEKEKDKKKDK